MVLGKLQPDKKLWSPEIKLFKSLSTNWICISVVRMGKPGMAKCNLRSSGDAELE